MTTTTTTIEARNPITIERIETRDFIAYEVSDCNECYVVARLNNAQLHALLERDSMLWDAGKHSSLLAA